MFNFKKNEKTFKYSDIDLIIMGNKERKYNKTLFKLLNENITTKKDRIDHSDEYMITQKSYFKKVTKHKLF